MKTLVYFASGDYRSEYQNLGFDRVILIDDCFKNRKHPANIINKGNVTCIGMDCLKAVQYLKTENIKIDCFVSLNEGLHEGGGRYAINSDFFLGFVMPLLSNSYIHIMNKNYYRNMYKVSMDLPFNIKEISENQEGFIDPFIFSKDSYHKKHAKVYQMTRIFSTQKLSFNPKLKTFISNDSIWNHYDNLDLVLLSITQQGQGAFFENLPKVINLNSTTLDQIFSYCVLNKIEKIGFTPWGKGHYRSFISQLKDIKDDYPKEIFLFHLNKDDYNELKMYATLK